MTDVGAFLPRNNNNNNNTHHEYLGISETSPTLSTCKVDCSWSLHPRSPGSRKDEFSHTGRPGSQEQGHQSLLGPETRADKQSSKTEYCHPGWTTHSPAEPVLLHPPAYLAPARGPFSPPPRAPPTCRAPTDPTEATDSAPKHGRPVSGNWEAASQGPAKSHKSRGRLPREAVDRLFKWLEAHRHHPFPTDKERQALHADTGLTIGESASCAHVLQDCAVQCVFNASAMRPFDNF